jgi:hypothetical protein
MHLCCDESGNTSVALLDQEQPFFALASTSIGPEAALALIGPLLRPGQREVKYSKAKANPDGRKKLVDLFSSSELVPSTCKFRATDKKYYLIAHMVDKLIEPPLHEAGVDLYAGDAQVRFTNVWFRAGEKIFPNGHWKRVPSSFLDAIRRRSDVSFAAFDVILARACATTPYEFADFANGLMLARGRLRDFIGVYDEMVVFDPAVDDFVALMQAWMSETAGSFSVTHDRSETSQTQRITASSVHDPDDATLHWIYDTKEGTPASGCVSRFRQFGRSSVATVGGFGRGRCS